MQVQNPPLQQNLPLQQNPQQNLPLPLQQSLQQNLRLHRSPQQNPPLHRSRRLSVSKCRQDHKSRTHTESRRFNRIRMSKNCTTIMVAKTAAGSHGLA